MAGDKKIIPYPNGLDDRNSHELDTIINKIPIQNYLQPHPKPLFLFGNLNIHLMRNEPLGHWACPLYKETARRRWGLNGSEWCEICIIGFLLQIHTSTVLANATRPGPMNDNPFYAAAIRERWFNLSIYATAFGFEWGNWMALFRLLIVNGSRRCCCICTMHSTAATNMMFIWCGVWSNHGQVLINSFPPGRHISHTQLVTNSVPNRN